MGAWNAMIAGMIAGALVTVVSYPLEYVEAKMQLAGAMKSNRQKTGTPASDVFWKFDL